MTFIRGINILHLFDLMFKVCSIYCKYFTVFVYFLWDITAHMLIFIFHFYGFIIKLALTVVHELRGKLNALFWYSFSGIRSHQYSRIHWRILVLLRSKSCWNRGYLNRRDRLKRMDVGLPEKK